MSAPASLTWPRHQNKENTALFGWLPGTAVERWASTVELSLSGARLAADG